MFACRSFESGEKKLQVPDVRCYLMTVLAGFLCLPGTLNAARRETSCPNHALNVNFTILFCDICLSPANFEAIELRNPSVPFSSAAICS
jgi:hypothetical protein